MSVTEFKFKPAAKRAPLAHVEKARLIAEALDKMRTLSAHGLDGLDSASLARLRDIEILLGVMEIEMLQRRAEGLRQHGDGGNHDRG